MTVTDIDILWGLGEIAVVLLVFAGGFLYVNRRAR